MVPTLPKLYWRIGVVMAERGVRTNRELRRKLHGVGYAISEPQLSRLRKHLPRKLDTEFLTALCRALQAQPGELLQMPVESLPAAARDRSVETPAKPMPAGAPAVTNTVRNSVTGPKLRPRSLPPI